MLAKDDQSPVISVSSYLRDLYQLIAMLMDDKQVMSDEHFRSLSVAFYETEVNRLLVWIAPRPASSLTLNTWILTRLGARSAGDTGPGILKTIPMPWISSSGRHVTSSYTLSKSSRTIVTWAITGESSRFEEEDEAAAGNRIARYLTLASSQSIVCC